MDVNYMGSVYATRAVIPGMKQRRRGRVVFVSSVAGVFGLFGFTAYSASKFALRGLAESLQMEVCFSFLLRKELGNDISRLSSKIMELFLVDAY